VVIGWRFVIVASLVAMCSAVLPNVRFATAVDDTDDTGGGPAPASVLALVTDR